MDREKLTKRATEIEEGFRLRMRGISDEKIGTLALIAAVFESAGGPEKLRTGDFKEEVELLDEMAENSEFAREIVNRFWKKK